MPWRRLCSRWHFRQNQPGFGDLILEIGVLGWVNVYAAGDHRDGAAGKRTVMRRSIDPACRSGNDDISLGAEVLQPAPVRSRCALIEALRAPTMATPGLPRRWTDPFAESTGGASSELRQPGRVIYPQRKAVLHRHAHSPSVRLRQRRGGFGNLPPRRASQGTRAQRFGRTTIALKQQTEGHWPDIRVRISRRQTICSSRSIVPVYGNDLNKRLMREGLFDRSISAQCGFPCRSEGVRYWHGAASS